MQVVDVRVEEKHGYNALKLGAINIAEKKVNKPELGQYRKLGVPPKRVVAEFRVTPNCFIPIGMRGRERERECVCVCECVSE